MGKTKTAFVAGPADDKKSGKAAYEEKRKKREEEEKRKRLEEKGGKDSIKGVGLKGGERIKTVSGGPEIEAVKEVTPDTQETAKGPKTRGHKYAKAKTLIDKTKEYDIKKAIELVKEASYSKFDGTLELHLSTKNEVSQNVTLPYSAGKSKKVEVADDSTIKKLKDGKIDFAVLLATADMMPKLVPFAKILGPRGLMPNPKAGTLIKNAKEAEKFSGNSVALKTEKKQNVIHTVVGKVSQKDIEIEANLQAILKVIGGAKQIEKAYLKATMSPSIKLKI